MARELLLLKVTSLKQEKAQEQAGWAGANSEIQSSLLSVLTKRSWRSQPENHRAQRHPESEAVLRILYLTATTGSVQLRCWPHSLILFHSAVWGTQHLPADCICEMPLIGNLSKLLGILDVWGWGRISWGRGKLALELTFSRSHRCTCQTSWSRSPGSAGSSGGTGARRRAGGRGCQGRTWCTRRWGCSWSG